MSRLLRVAGGRQVGVPADINLSASIRPVVLREPVDAVTFDPIVDRLLPCVSCGRECLDVDDEHAGDPAVCSQACMDAWLEQTATQLVHGAVLRDP